MISHRIIPTDAESLLRHAPSSTYFRNMRLMPNFQRVHDSLVKLGINPSTLYRDVGISQQEINRDQVSLPHYLKLLNRAAEVHQRPFIGLEMAQVRETSDLGLYGYLISNAVDYRGLFQLANKYLEVVTPGAVGKLVEASSHAIWTYELPGLGPELCRQDVEMTMMEYTWLTRNALDLEDWRPLQVYFQHAAPADPAPLQQAITPKITFNHWFNGVVFPSQLLDVRISNSDPGLLKLLQAEIDNLREQLHLLGEDNLLTRISLMITSGIGKGDITSDSLAHGLYMSRRSLHRRLAEAQTSVQEIRDNVVSRLAKEMLANTRSTISEISSMLGYSEASAFVRGFKRLTGQTPSAYRKKFNASGT